MQDLTASLNDSRWRAQDFRLMRLELTAIFQKVDEEYIGVVEELPGVNTQAATLDEARANLDEAVQLVLEANRTMVEEEIQGSEVIRERLHLRV